MGFTKLNELLANEETKDMLLRRNPRLLRTFFMSQGTAGLWRDCPAGAWKVYLPEKGGSYSRKRSYSYWTTTPDKGVVCFSFPNHGAAGRLCLSIEARHFPARCRRFRLYNQETGDIVFDSGQLRRHGIGASKNAAIETTRIDPLSNRRSTSPHFYFPEIDFTAVSSKWIDIEIEYTPARSWSSLRRIRKILRKG